MSIFGKVGNTAALKMSYQDRELCQLDNMGVSSTLSTGFYATHATPKKGAKHCIETITHFDRYSLFTDKITDNCVIAFLNNSYHKLKVIYLLTYDLLRYKLSP